MEVLMRERKFLNMQDNCYRSQITATGATERVGIDIRSLQGWPIKLYLLFVIYIMIGNIYDSSVIFSDAICILCAPSYYGGAL